MRELAQQLLGQVHQVGVVLVGLVELQHGELGIVPGRDALIAEVAVDLEHLLESADDEPLQVQLRRDAQVELHVERVVLGDERPCRGAAGDRMHHRRLDFEIAAAHEEIADALDDLRTLDEHVARGCVGDEVHIPLAVPLLLIGHAMEFLRQRPQRLREQADIRHPDRQLAGLGLEQMSRRTDDVAQVPVLEIVEPFGAERVERDVELDAAGHVLHGRKTRLAHHALQHHAAGDGHLQPKRFELLVGLCIMLRVQIRGKRIAPEIVRVGVAPRAQFSELAAALVDDLVLVDRRRLLRHVPVLGHPHFPF